MKQYSSRMRRGLCATVILLSSASVAACGSSGSSGLPGIGGTSAPAADSGYDAIITSGPVATAGDITPGSWEDKVKQRGVLKTGGTTTGAIFSLLDPTTGKVKGFDAGLAQLLAHYITGKTDVNSLVQISQTTVDTRETMLQNHSVDAVIATYSITPA